jgi:hypothetical protein
MKKNQQMLKDVIKNVPCDLTKSEEFQVAVELCGFLSQDHVGQDELWNEVQPLVMKLVESMAGGLRTRMEYMCAELPHVFKLNKS